MVVVVVVVVVGTALAAGVSLALAGQSSAATAALPCAAKLQITPHSGTIWRLWDDQSFAERFTLSGGSGHYYWQEYNEPPPGFSVSFYPRQNGSPNQLLSGRPTHTGVYSYSLNLYDYPNWAPPQPNGLYPPGHDMSCAAGATPTYTIIVVSKSAVNDLLSYLSSAKELAHEARDSVGDSSAAREVIQKCRLEAASAYGLLSQIENVDPESKGDPVSTRLPNAKKDILGALVDVEKASQKLSLGELESDPALMDDLVYATISAYQQVETYAASFER
jgi:hypothetical protein